MSWSADVLEWEPGTASSAEPVCPIYGACGGCSYQHLSYEEELALKENRLRALMSESLKLDGQEFSPIVRSPKEYHYRNRLDLAFRRLKTGDYLMGFQPANKKRILPAESCAIAEKAVSDYLPQMKQEAIARLPENYRNANLVIKTGQDGRVAWGGIGRRSLQMNPEDYFWTEIRGKRIFFSLDTFFQANLSILPSLMTTLEGLAQFDRQTTFLDLYAGVGLFGIYFADKVKNAVLIEESVTSVKVMRFNKDYHQYAHVDVRESKVERELPVLTAVAGKGRMIAMIDPPRRGLSEEVCRTVASATSLEKLFYLSCHPESLIRDLKIMQEAGWKIRRIVPFDFFPKTAHLETLVLLIP